MRLAPRAQFSSACRRCPALDYIPQRGSGLETQPQHLGIEGTASRARGERRGRSIVFFPHDLVKMNSRVTLFVEDGRGCAVASAWVRHISASSKKTQKGRKLSLLAFFAPPFTTGGGRRGGCCRHGRSWRWPAYGTCSFCPDCADPISSPTVSSAWVHIIRSDGW